MGVTVSSPNSTFDTGYFTFNALRTDVAGMLSDGWRAMYLQMHDLFGDEDYKRYDKAVNALAKKLDESDQKVVDFLYMSDCDGECSPDMCVAIASLLERNRNKWTKRTYAYAAHPPFTMADFHDMLIDGVNTGKGIRWC